MIALPVLAYLAVLSGWCLARPEVHIFSTFNSCIIAKSRTVDAQGMIHYSLTVYPTRPFCNNIYYQCEVSREFYNSVYKYGYDVPMPYDRCREIEP